MAAVAGGGGALDGEDAPRNKDLAGGAARKGNPNAQDVDVKMESGLDPDFLPESESREGSLNLGKIIPGDISINREPELEVLSNVLLDSNDLAVSTPLDGDTSIHRQLNAMSPRHKTEQLREASSAADDTVNETFHEVARSVSQWDRCWPYGARSGMGGDPSGDAGTSKRSKKKKNSEAMSEVRSFWQRCVCWRPSPVMSENEGDDDSEQPHHSDPSLAGHALVGGPVSVQTAVPGHGSDMDISDQSDNEL